MTSVVITGASGFIGKYLCSGLVEAGLDVIPVSRRVYPGMIHVKDYADTPIADILIHLAEEPDRGLVNQRGEENLAKSQMLMRVLTARKFRKIIYVSSSSVYGSSFLTPRKISDEVFRNDIYNQGKLTNESLVLAAGGCVIRLSNLFGKGMSQNNVISHIIHQIPRQGPLFVHDDLPVRDYLHVADAVNAMVLFATSRCTGLFNVGTGIGTSVRQLVEILLASAGQGCREVVITNSIRTASTNILDISETNRAIGWRPQANLADKLAELVVDTV